MRKTQPNGSMMLPNPLVQTLPAQEVAVADKRKEGLVGAVGVVDAVVGEGEGEVTELQSTLQEPAFIIRTHWCKSGTLLLLLNPRDQFMVVLRSRLTSGMCHCERCIICSSSLSVVWKHRKLC